MKQPRSRTTAFARTTPSPPINQGRVLHALILRELHTRYGRENLGFLWVIGEPLILATVITLLHLNEPTRYGNDIAPAPFAIIGYTVFIIFRNTFNRAEGAIETNQSLLYHRSVTILDILTARIGMEVISCFAVTAILLTVFVFAGFASPPARPLYLITASMLMGWMTFGLTLIASALSYRNEIVSRQVHVLSYLSIPVSGAFYTLSGLPPSFRDKLQWFPMPLIFEQARYGQFRSASPDFVSPWYVSAWCAGLTYLGLVLTRRIRSKVYG